MGVDLGWVIRIVLCVVFVVVLGLVLVYWKLTTIGDRAADDAETSAREVAQSLAARLDFGMTDTEITEQASKRKEPGPRARLLAV